MAISNIIFGGNRVGLLVRGKSGPDDEPGLLAQHADCVLSNGMPVGFFGEGSRSKSAAAPSGSGASSAKSVGSSNAKGFAMSGVVYDLAKLQIHRAPYVDQGLARASGVVTTVVLVQVSPNEAKAFDDAWASIGVDPGSFQIMGHNCSTHASQAFRQAGILSGGIPGLDTPNNLYKQLCAEKADKIVIYSGYVGFTPLGQGCIMVVDAL